MLGIAVIGVANELYQEEQYWRNIEAAKAAAAATASAGAASSSSSSIVTVNPGPYSITCAYTATGLDTSKITSATDGSLAVYTGSGSTTITNSDETVSLTLTNARRRSLFDYFNLKSVQEEFLKRKHLLK